MTGADGDISITRLKRNSTGVVWLCRIICWKLLKLVSRFSQGLHTRVENFSSRGSGRPKNYFAAERKNEFRL